MRREAPRSSAVDGLFAGADRVAKFSETSEVDERPTPASAQAEDGVRANPFSPRGIAALHADLRAPLAGHGRPWRGRRNAGAPSLRLAALDAYGLTAVRDAPWAPGFTIMVASRKGGVGRTPTALLLGGVIAAVRGGRVCVMETSEGAGHLLGRAEGGTSQQFGIVELLHAIGAGHGRDALERCVAAQSSQADVLGSTQMRDQLSGEHVRRMHALVASEYPVVVLDTGANQETPAFQRSLEAASAVVLVTTLHVDAVLDLVSTLAVLRISGRVGAELAARAVVLVMDDGRPVDRDQARRLRELIDETGVRAVAPIPFDPHIAAGRELSLGLLTEESQRAWLHAAALVATSSTTNTPNQHR